MTKTELIHKWFDDLWHEGIESTIDELLASDAVAHGLAAGDMVGRDSFREFYRAFKTAFPKTRVKLAHVLECGEFAVSQIEGEVIAANGSGPFHFHGSTTVRIRNDQIVEGWNNFDFLTLLIGMGVVPADAMATALTAAATPNR